MKKNILLIGCMLLGLTACYKPALDPLTGVFPAPTVVDFANGTCEAYKLDGKRYFELNLAEGSTTFKATLVGNQYYLTANAYTEADEASAKNGNFILGKTSVNGTQVKTGTITIGQNGEDYTLKAVVFLTDGSPYKFTWKGKLSFVPDPEPVKLTELLIAQANANSTVTVKLGTEGMTIDGMGTPTGDGYALTADIYSADGKLHEGVYTAAASSENVGPGEFTPGYEYDLSEWGLGIMHWGTCWWVGANVTHITSGTLEVALKGDKFVITWGNESTFPNWAQFEGAIEELYPGGGGGEEYDGVTLTQNFGITDYTGYGIPMVGIDLGTEGITCTPGDWGNTYGGDGNYLKLEIYSADGKIAPGTYTACAEGGVIGEGEFGIGYDGMFGASGTTWYTLVGGEASYQYITDGVVYVELDGDQYKISIESTVIKARYGYEGQGGGGGGGDFDGTVLTKFLGASNYTIYGVNLAGVELGTDGITVTPGDWGNTYGGDGNYIKLEFYSTDGSLAPGEYKPCAVGGQVGEGEFGIGYDGDWGASGTTWYTLGGGEVSYAYVTDGSLIVEKSGDVYTIVLDSTTVKFKYEGKLSAE